VKPAALVALGLLLVTPSASAAFDTYSTSAGHRATAAYPDVVNKGDIFVVSVNADPGTGQVASFESASGWEYHGCKYVSHQFNSIGATRTQTARLNMTDDTCTFHLRITWANSLGQANALTTIQGSVATDDQDQSLFAKEFVGPIAWFVWIAYLVLLYKVKQTPLRVVAVLVGFCIVLAPMGQVQAGILLAGQLAVAIIFLIQLISERT
jgi:hypothetical protein